MKASIFDYLDYVSFIKDTSKEIGINYKSLANSARIHSSYFSRVMQEKADFSREQLFLISNDLKLNSEEKEFLLLLGEYKSSSLDAHKKFLFKKIKKIKNEKLKLLNKLTSDTDELSSEDITIYYQESITAKIHMMLTLDKYRYSPNLISKKLFISDTKLNREIKKLAGLNIIKFKDDKITLLKHSVHLDEAHPASIQNHINWRMESINHLTKRNANPSDYHLSAVFSCDDNAKMEIKNKFKKFIIDVQKIVQKSETNEEVYYIGLDLH